jgi:hypothetical protein
VNHARSRKLQAWATLIVAAASPASDIRPLRRYEASAVLTLGALHTELLGFWTLSIVRILIVTRKNKNKHDVSETGSVSVLR